MKSFGFFKKIFFGAMAASFLAQPFSVLAAAPAVTGLAANFSANSATLSWTTPADASLTELEIRYAAGSLNDGNFNLANQVAGPLPAAGAVQSFTVSGLNSATAYSFGIRARNFLGEESPIVYVSGSTSAGGGGGGPVNVCLPPAPVSAFQVTAVTANSVSLSWNVPNLANLSDLEVRYSANPINDGAFNFAAEAPAAPLPEGNATQNFTVSGLSSNTTYYFAVKIWNVCGEESLITSVSAVTANTASGGSCLPPALPASLALGGATANSLNLSWITPNQGNLSELEARYSAQPLNDGNFNLAARFETPNPQAGTAQSAIATGLNPNTNYYFGLRAQNACGDYSGIAYVSGSTNNFTPAASFSGGSRGSAVFGQTGLRINGGASTTASRAVSLELTAERALEMWISESKNFETGSWEPFASTTAWILSSGLGQKTVYAKFRDDRFTGFSEAQDEIELVAAAPVSNPVNLPSRPGTSPAPVVSVPAAPAVGRVWLEIVPKQIKVSGDGEVRAVVIAHADGISADYFRLELKYPAENLRLKAVEFAPAMTPDFGPGANLEDAERGLLVKSAQSEVPFRGRKFFATLVFEPIAAGEGNLEILSAADYKNDSWRSGLAVISEPGANRGLLASLVSPGRESNVAAMFAVWAFFVLAYMGYLAVQKYRRGL